MQTAPEHGLRQAKTQKNLPSVFNGNEGSKDVVVRKLSDNMYSPLETNRNNSQCENGQIMASARDGGTPITAMKNGEDKALISEFDPLGSTAKKFEDNMAGTPNQVIGFSTQNMPATLTSNNYFGQTQVMEPALIVTS